MRMNQAVCVIPCTVLFFNYPRHAAKTFLCRHAFPARGSPYNDIVENHMGHRKNHVLCRKNYIGRRKNYIRPFFARFKHPEYKNLHRHR